MAASSRFWTAGRSTTRPSPAGTGRCRRPPIVHRRRRDPPAGEVVDLTGVHRGWVGSGGPAGLRPPTAARPPPTPPGAAAASRTTDELPRLEVLGAGARVAASSTASTSSSVTGSSRCDPAPLARREQLRDEGTGRGHSPQPGAAEAPGGRPGRRGGRRSPASRPPGLARQQADDAVTQVWTWIFDEGGVAVVAASGEDVSPAVTRAGRRRSARRARRQADEVSRVGEHHGTCPGARAQKHVERRRRHAGEA